MKRIILLATIAALASVGLVAQEIVVGYVDGVLQVREGTSWADLFIGDGLEPSDQIRLRGDAYAELTTGQTTVKLSRSGTYEVSDLIEGTGRTESAGIAGLVLNRIGRLTGREDGQQEQTAAGGARASEAVNQNAPTWAGGESVDELIDEGVSLLNEGAYQDAYYVFQEAYDYAITDAEYGKALFYYGYAFTLVGKSAQAFDLLEENGPDPQTDYFANHVLALGQLLVESFAYQEAIGYLELLENADGQDPEDRQSAQLLMGIAYDGLGMADEAQAYLERARRTVPGTAAADAADQLLGDL
jgi:tetratricopeptide (TPR) repeat protein